MTTLRQFTCDDLFRFNGINLDPLTEMYGLSFYLQYLARWPEYFMVAESPSGALMGYIMGKSEGQNENWHGHVTAVTVGPQYRRLGLANKLMHGLEELSDSKNCYFVDLFVRVSNTIAISFYNKLGYTVYRTVLQYYSGDMDEDAYDMRKALTMDVNKKGPTMPGQFFSLISAAEEGSEKESELSDLFKKSSKKDAPAYDYSEVDNKKRNNHDSKDDDDEDDLSDLGDVDEEQEKVESEEKKVVADSDRSVQVQHEDTKTRQVDEEKDKRTVFVGNLSVQTKKSKLKQLFSQHGKVETVRFRCAGRPDMKTTKKVAVIRQKFHEQRNNICAYIRMSSVEEAEAACSLNGSSLDGFTIRVDVSSQSKSHDNKKSVFLGNLHFNTKEEDVRRLFSKVGEVENVRLIRDASTGMGKGFGYVNFATEESVQLAVRLNQHEVEGRKIRVSRAVRKPKPGTVKQSGTGGSKQKSWNESKRKEFKVNKKREKTNIERKKFTGRKEKENTKGRKVESKGFQGVKSSNANKKNFKKVSKTEKKKKVMAKLLS